MTNNMTALTLDQVRQNAPAAFSVVPDARMSDSYAHVTTASVLDALLQDGWSIVNAQQRKSRLVTSAEHNAHRISLVHPELPEHKEGIAQMHLGNSGNGSSAVRLMGGFLRMACLNQNFVGVKVIGGVVHHRGANLHDRVVGMARDLRANFDKVIQKFDLWNQIEMSPAAQLAFARDSLALRWPTKGPEFAELADMLAARRSSDTTPTLWSTYNRVQESLIRGGFTATFRQPVEGDEAAAGRLVTRRVRKVTGLNANERINTGLWSLADSVAALVTA